MARLQDQVAVITGAASGIGRATVAKFVAEGARVVAVDRQPERGAELERSFDGSVAFLAGDVGCEDDVRAMIELAVSRFGRLDCVFNNAGFGGVSGEVHELDFGADYAATVDAMLKGPLLAMKHAAPVMRAQGSGSIITTASVAGLRGGYGPHVYSAIKASVIGLTRSVALELGPHNVRVNAICPGGIATAIFAGHKALEPGDNVDWAATVRPFLARIQPIPRAGEPDDIACAACFLASSEASFITGQALVVDGGLTACNFRHAELTGEDSGLVEAIRNA